MTDFLSSLNEQQQEAVLVNEGPLLILAGAGSGKTRVIAHRIAYLIAEKGVAPWNILAVTFTNKAAQEMRQRVQRLLRDQELPALPLVSTFHSLCVRILRQDIEKLNQKYTRTFTIYDQDDSLRLIKNCIKDLGYDEKYLGLRATQSAISSAKNRGEDVEAFAARAEYVDERRAAMARVYATYEERLHANNALDFDDLLIKTVRLLRQVPEAREKYNNKFRYILVDEYQDTNSLQFALISLLTEKQQNIAVVGDEDQSIYKWRGADITNILNFEKHFPNTKTIRLEQNYRSTQTILDVAGAVVKHNVERKGKTLWTSNPQGDRVRYFQAFDAESEARFVASKILEHRSDEYDLRAAVLYRTNSQSRVFEEAMRRAGLKYNIVGGFSFYERMEVRDIISYLKLALNPNDSIALQRVINSPARGIGRQTLDELTRRSNQVQSPTSNVQRPGSLANSSPEAESAVTGTAGVSPADSVAASSLETAKPTTGTAGVSPADSVAASSLETAKPTTGTAGVSPADSVAASSLETAKPTTGTAGVSPADSVAASSLETAKPTTGTAGVSPADSVAASSLETAKPTTGTAGVSPADSVAASSLETAKPTTGTAGVSPADSVAASSLETAKPTTGTAGVSPADSVAASSLETAKPTTGTAGVSPAKNAAGANRASVSERGSSPTVTEGSADPSLSLWETISVVIDDPQNLSSRAVSALKSFRRIILRLAEMADQNPETDNPSAHSVSDIVKAAILDTGYENALKGEKTDEAEARLENLQELVNAAVDYDEQGLEGLREFIDHSALVSDTDQYKGDAPVTLMTAHSAKGLEFPLVFIVGLEDGLLPHSRSATDPAELEEERRLCYVAMTRAERYLYVTHAMKRRVYGEELAAEPSQFLNEMPLDLMEDLSRGNSWLSFARGSSEIDYEGGEYRPGQTAQVRTGSGSDRVIASDRERGSSPTVREGFGGSRKDTSNYAGKTYDSVDSIAEFFKQRSKQLGNTSGSFQSTREKAEQEKSNRGRVQRPTSNVQRPGNQPGSETRNSKLETRGSSPLPLPPSPNSPSSSSGPVAPTDLVPGSYVKHAKYGRGLVLRREGIGDSLKLTVTFPGYGQKKLVQKYAGLEKA